MNDASGIDAGKQDGSFSYASPTPLTRFPGSVERGSQLFDFQSVILATFLGTPVAGALLMALNYRRIGQKGAAVVTLMLGIVVSALLAFVGYVVPGVSAPLGLAGLLGMSFLARKLQGAVVSEHKAAGGAMGSKWTATWVGLGFLVVIGAGLAVPLYVNSSRSKVVVGTKDEVFYNGAATKADATALGEALRKIGYFQDRGTSVFLDKDKDGTTVSLVQREGVWDQPEMLANSEEVVREVAYSIGGYPVKVKLINAAEDVKKTGVIGRTVVGTKDEVFYEGTATDADGQALGHALQDAKYFQDRGTSVLLSKDGRGTVMSFVVSDGIWDDAASVAAFEVIARAVAPTVGGFPVTLRLVNTGLENKKEITLK